MLWIIIVASGITNREGDISHAPKILDFISLNVELGAVWNQLNFALVSTSWEMEGTHVQIYEMRRICWNVQ